MRNLDYTRPAAYHEITEAVGSCPAVRVMVDRLPGPGQHYALGGVLGSTAAAVVAALRHAQPGRLWVVVASNPNAAGEIKNDLDTLLGMDEARIFPQREALPYESEEPHLEVSGQRVEAAEALLSGRCTVLVTTLRALQEKSFIPDRLVDLRIDLEVGDEHAFGTLAERLGQLGFDRVPLVETVGQFAIRGGIFDIFSFGATEPVRIEFWGDEITSIRTFSVLDQRSTGETGRARVLPVDFRATPDAQSGHARSLLELFGDGTVLVDVECSPWRAQADRAWKQVEDLHRELLEEGRTPLTPDELVLPPEALRTRVAQFGTLRLQEAATDADATLGASPPPEISRNMRRLKRTLEEGGSQGIKTLVLCDNEGQVERLEEILGEGRVPGGTRLAVGSLGRGFELVCADPRLRVMTDHEIFRRARRLRRGRRFRGAVALESLAQLVPGDHVVHMDHGIGRFRGLEKLTVGSQEIEALAIEYAGDEILRVPVYRIDLLERWVGASSEAKAPAIHRIGGKRWQGLKKKTEAAIQKMAAELLELYATRATAEGRAFPPDTQWQREMESSFLYEDTPDQRKATADVKKDMESPRPMDRLVCGDVGYGKTEVAIRAAFKAVQDGVQVAVLAPTTILAEQHRHTFEERLADYPVNIGTLSRFRTAAEQEDILDGLAEGSVDIVIGTHRILSPDVRFAALGLLIVDEEQRFGVKHKERLKELRSSVDVLTLTATPIPRTLHLAISGLRDLTLIRTPPRDRMPIITHVLPWRDPILADALHRELDRAGQVFFVHNRVETIHTAAARVQALAPEASVDIAHGQMRPAELDDVMRRFVDGKLDVLVCSSIIENGLDVPNANTLIVDGADRFGLSQLYQIRGRVGRSDRRAFCYLIVPERVSEDAEKRLRVLEHYTDLGSGYAVAMKDLELRGAGNLLGSDQSGFAQAVGLDTYMRLLRETIDRMNRSDEVPEHPEPDVFMDGGAYLTDDYVSDAHQKLHLYRRLSSTSSVSDIDSLADELTDRFGPRPAEVDRLLDLRRLTLLGRPLGVERIFVRGRKGRLNFRPGVSPRMATIDEAMGNRQVSVEVRRLAPLSLTMKQEGGEPLMETLIEALEALAAHEAEPTAERSHSVSS